MQHHGQQKKIATVSPTVIGTFLNETTAESHASVPPKVGILVVW